MKNLFIYCFCISCLFLSCSSKDKKEKDKSKYTVEINWEESSIPPFDALQLKSYYLSAPVQVDPHTTWVAYNYKAHTLDCIDLNEQKISQIPLQKEGVNAVDRLTGIAPYTRDSIWVSDETGRIMLINHEGSVQKKFSRSDYLKEKEELIVNSNFAMSTIRLYYHNSHRSLMCTIKDRNTNPTSFKVKEIFVDGQHKTNIYKLEHSVVEPNTCKGYANMSDPNVNFTEQYILYNYPIESHLYRMNLETEEQEVFEADSRYTKNKAEKCHSETNYQEWDRHGYENPHFYDLMYLSDLDIYARLHMDRTDYPQDNEREQTCRNRAFYLCLYDNEFHCIVEMPLPKGVFDPFTGWSFNASTLLFFVDNSKQSTENTEVMLMHPIRKD